MTTRSLGPTYYSVQFDKLVEERAIREANAVLRGEWRPPDSKGGLLVVLIGLLAGAAFLFSQC